LLDKADILPRVERTFEMADGTVLVREIGFAILQAEGFETIDEVVFGEIGDLTLVGVRTIEGFGVMVDNIGHRLVARSHLAAGNFKK